MAQRKEFSPECLEAWILILTGSLLALCWWAVTEVFGCHFPARGYRIWLLQFLCSCRSLLRALSRVCVSSVVLPATWRRGEKECKPTGVVSSSALAFPAKHEEIQDVLRWGKSRAFTRLDSLIASWAVIFQSVLLNHQQKYLSEALLWFQPGDDEQTHYVPILPPKKWQPPCMGPSLIIILCGMGKK